MHPALSVIFFTAISGVGYGAMLLLGLAVLFEPAGFEAGKLAFALLLAGALAAAGLLASMLHLGQPLRAWRAFSQWRSSWLSREGVASVLTFVPLVAAFALVARANEGAALRVSGATVAVGAVLTLYCTANIYRSLKTVRAWHNGYVWPGYLLHALLGGGTLLWTIAAFATDALPRGAHIVLFGIVFLASRLLGRVKAAYWTWLDAAPLAPDAGAATGLAHFGTVRSVEAPHTEENYLTQEMGFRLARKHAAPLRAIALALSSVLPTIAAAIGLIGVTWSALGGLEPVIAPLALIAAVSGAFVERWLFFAEARHSVMAYYQANAA